MHRPLNDINDVLRAVLDDLRPKPKFTPSRQQRQIMKLQKAQKKLLRKTKRAGAANHAAG